MNRVPSFVNNTSHRVDALLKSNRQQEKNDFSSRGEVSTGFLAASGFDLTQIPVHPALHTNHQIQCCAKDGAGCSCPKCKAAAEAIRENDNDETQEQSEVEKSEPEQTASEQSVPEQTPEETSQAGESNEPEQAEDENVQQQSTTGLIVEDSITDLSEGQMHKTEFLQELRTSICNTIGPVLATVGQTTEGCPYLNYWLDLYQEKSAAHIESTAKKYAPDAVNAKTTGEYISIITQRALRAAEIWAKTGKLSGVPEGVPTTLPNNPSSESDGKNRGVKRSQIQAKSKDGKYKTTDDPIQIQEELGEGQPLSTEIRSRMEPLFGMSLSHVRTHTDSVAANLSNRVSAHAFTVGKHVAFGDNEYNPGTPLGDALIAHELAHVVQQGNQNDASGNYESTGVNYNELENDADRTATGIVSSLWRRSVTSMETISYKAVPRLRSGLRLQRCKDKAKPTPTPTPTPPSGPCIPTFTSLEAKKTGSIAMTTAWSGNCEMAFGSPGGAGMTTEGKVNVPAGCTGKLELVQLVDTCRSYINPAATAGGTDTNTRLKSSGYVLDTTDPYASQIVTSAGAATVTTNDSPGDQTVGRKKIFVTDKFKIWLMWTPDTPAGSPRVPLAVAEWNWTAKTTKTGNTGCSAAWTISDDAANGGTGVSTTTSPSWTSNVTGLTEAAGTCP